VKYNLEYCLSRAGETEGRRWWVGGRADANEWKVEY
jgi:hypothetical protein